MSDSRQNNETPPNGEDSSSGLDGEPLDDQLLDAGIEAAFREANAVPRSVVQILGETTDLTPAISLREIPDAPSPIHRPAGSKDDYLPDRLGRYQIAGQIGRGGVGSVHKARDVDIGRDVALKVLLEEHRDNPEMTQRFVEEAQISGQLQHPGIVPVHELGLVAGKRPYIALKLVKGKTLARLLDDRENVQQDSQRFFGIFEQICQPLAYAHARGVIHRDLKPSNVMIGPFGEVQVMDWGLAKVLAHGGNADDRRGTKSRRDASEVHTIRDESPGSDSLAGSVLGTPAYMPPEQARGEVDHIDERSDVFGLGAILCEILTGKPPYTGSNTDEVHRAARNGYLEGALERLDRCGADAEVVALAKRCLAFEPRERPRDAGAVAKHIRAHLDSVAERAKSLEIQAAEARVRAQGERKARTLTVVLAAMAIVSVIAGALGYISIEQNRLSIEQSRRDRQARITASFHAALSDASALRERARASLTESSTEWPAVIEAVKRARAIASEDAPVLRERAEKLLAEVQSEFHKHRFLSRLDAIWQDFTTQPTSTTNQSYDLAFRKFFGVNLFTIDPDEAAKRIRESGCVQEVARALDLWAVARDSLGLGVTSFVVLAATVDRDPFLKKVRGSLIVGLQPDFEQEFAEAVKHRVSEHRLFALGWLLGRSGDLVRYEAILRRALDLYPERHWPYAVLASVLRAQQPPRTDESLRYQVAGTARTPWSVLAWMRLANSFYQHEEYANALDASVRDAELRPGHGDPYGQIWPILTEHPAAELGPALDRATQGFERILASGCLVSPFAREALALARARRCEEQGDDVAAIRVIELARSFPGVPDVRNELLEELRAKVAPDIASYASIDAALTARPVVVAEGATWRYFRGTREPSEGIEWTVLDFDDGSWETGASGFGYGDKDDNTLLDDMLGAYTTVYVRHVFKAPPVEGIQKLVLSVRSDDGFVAYLNGEEIGRAGIPATPLRVPYDAVATRRISNAITDFVDVPLERVRSGKNVLAIQGLNAVSTSSDFSLIPVLSEELDLHAALERYRRRLEEFRAVARGPDAHRRLAYFEGRLLELEGRHAEAAARFREVLREDPGDIRPYAHLAACLLAAGRNEQTTGELRSLLVADDPRFAPLWNEWLVLSLVDLRQAPRQVLELLPPRIEPTSESREHSATRLPPRYVDEVRWLLETVDRREAIRINCGNQRYVTGEGVAWERDRFFTGGQCSNAELARWITIELEDSEDGPVFGEGRYYRWDDVAPAGYRLPLPPGRYRVGLYFSEILYSAQPGSRVFDVVIEGRRVLEKYDAFDTVGFARLDIRRFEVDVTDGILDIVLERREENPRIVALEIEVLD